MSFATRAMRAQRQDEAAGDTLVDDDSSRGRFRRFLRAAPVAAPEVPKAPTMAAEPVRKAVEEERRRRASAGRASTILTGPLGVEETSQSSAKILLGAGY